MRASERRELSTIWWFQLGLSLAVVGITFVSAPWVLTFWHDLPDGAVWLLRGLSLGLFFTMLRAVPMLLLERNLRYELIGGLEFVGTLAFYGTAVIMASRGAGATSLVSASVAQAACLALATNLLQPFVPSFAFDSVRLRALMKFGVAFQGKNVIGFLNQAVTPVFAGARLGQTLLGHVQFAQQVGYFPSLPVGIIARVSFPVLSRLQTDRAAFASELERAVLMCGIPTFWFTGLVLGVGPSIVSVVYSDKWLPAVPALYVYALTFANGFYFMILGSALDALGKPQLLLRLFVLAAAINWACVVIATSLSHSALAFALGYAVHVGVGNVAILIAIKRLVPEARPLARLGAPLLGALVVMGFGRLALPYTASPLRLTATGVLSALLFASIVLALDRALWNTLKAAIERRRRPAGSAA
jgi:O-antigen/teichoic acid export membrane protein